MINIDRYVEGSDYRQEQFAPAALQTVFTLATVPVDVDTLQFIVNGVKYELTTNYTVVGVTVTWLNTPFTIQATDFIEIIYIVRE